MVLSVSLALLLAASPAEALATARKQLAADKLDDAFFTLEGQKFEGASAGEAAEVLSAAGRRALELKDPVMAISFAGNAVKLAPSSPLAHEILARAYKQQQQFGPSEAHADRWISASEEAEGTEAARRHQQVARARLFRAELALEQGDWGMAEGLAEALGAAPLSAEERKVATRIQRQATQELKDRKIGRSTAKLLDARMEQAIVEAKRIDARRAAAGPASPSASAGKVIVYTTSWCGYSKKAVRYLREKGIPFVERDLEKDLDAAQELAQKAARAGVRARGVPVLDVKGTLLLGWNPTRLQQLLGR